MQLLAHSECAVNSVPDSRLSSEHTVSEALQEKGHTISGEHSKGNVYITSCLLAILFSSSAFSVPDSILFNSSSNLLRSLQDKRGQLA